MSRSEAGPKKVVKAEKAEAQLLYDIHLELFFSLYRINKTLEEIMENMTYKTSGNYRNKRSPSRQGDLDHVRELLEKLDPDMWYGDWLRVLMAIFYESGGSEEGFELANTWSSRGYKYKNEKDVRYKWDSFDLSHSHPITIGTLIRMAKVSN